jgi:hypothetical protein
MSIFKKVIEHIELNKPFGFDLNGFNRFPDKFVGKEPNCVVENSSAVGWHLQEFVKKSLYKDYLIMGFEPLPNGKIALYYE